MIDNGSISTIKDKVNRKKCLFYPFFRYYFIFSEQEETAARSKKVRAAVRITKSIEGIDKVRLVQRVLSVGCLEDYPDYKIQ